MLLPPVLTGATHETATLEVPEVAVTVVGTPGAEGTVTSAKFTVADFPIELWAVMNNL
jgi:hypothetical protein